MTFRSKLRSFSPMLCLLILLSPEKGCLWFGGSPTTIFNHTQDVVREDNGLDNGLGRIIMAWPRPNQHVAGQFQFDLQNARGSIKSYSKFTNVFGRYDLPDGRVNAVWILSTDFEPPCPTKHGPVEHDQVEVNLVEPHTEATWECTYTVQEASNKESPKFSLTSNYPTTFTAYTEGTLSTQYAMPYLLVYQHGGNIIAQTAALDISPDARSATFPYPRNSDGSLLPPDMYAYAVINAEADGWHNAGGNWFSLGERLTGYPRAFGVDAASFQSSTTYCSTDDIYNDGTCAGVQQCSTSSGEGRFPIVTLYDAGQLNVGGLLLPVGSHPTVVHSFNWTTSSSGASTGACSYYNSYVTGPQVAIVVNTGSNSVTYVDLVNGSTIGEIQVGHQPVDVAVSSDSTKAYVVNSGDGTVSEVDLSTLQQTRTTFVGSQPSGISVNAGQAWVGGNGFIAKLDLPSMTVLETHPISGKINSLAISQGFNQVVTALDPSSVQDAVITRSYSSTDGQTSSSYNTSGSAAQDYASSVMSASLLNPAQLGTGALVSENSMDNAFAVTANGSHFTVFDLSSGGTVIAGTLEAPIRSFALEPGSGVAYFTIPDSDSVIRMPIPPLPQE